MRHGPIHFTFYDAATRSPDIYRNGQYAVTVAESLAEAAALRGDLARAGRDRLEARRWARRMHADCLVMARHCRAQRRRAGLRRLP